MMKIMYNLAIGTDLVYSTTSFMYFGGFMFGAVFAAVVAWAFFRIIL